MNATYHPLYSTYNGAGFQWPLVMPALLCSLLAVVGIVLNGSVCLLTIKHRKANTTLGSNTAVLIALASFFELLHQVPSHFLFLVIMASGTNFAPARAVFAIEASSVFGLQAVVTMFPLLGADRLLAVSAPIFYRNMRQRYYISACLLAILCVGGWKLLTLLSTVNKIPDWPMTGAICEYSSLPGVDQSVTKANLCLVCATVVAYLATGLTVKCRTDLTSDKMQRVYRALFLIVLVHIGGYFITVLCYNLYTSSILNISPVQFWFLIQYTGVLLNIGSVASGPILYVNSSEYRAVYIKELKKLKNWTNVRIFGQNENPAQQ